MKLTYTITFEDFKEAQRLHRNAKFTRRLIFGFWYWLIPAGTVCMLVATAVAVAHGEIQSWKHLLPVDGVLLWISIYPQIARSYSMRRGFEQIFPPSRTDGTSAIDIDDERILSAIPGVSEGKFFWSAVLDFAQNDKITLIYVAKDRFLYFPTSALSVTERSELTAVVNRNLRSR